MQIYAVHIRITANLGKEACTLRELQSVLTCSLTSSTSAEKESLAAYNRADSFTCFQVNPASAPADVILACLKGAQTACIDVFLNFSHCWSNTFRRLGLTQNLAFKSPPKPMFGL